MQEFGNFLETLVKVVERLTIGKIFLILLLGMVGVLLAFVYDNKEQIISQVLNNHFALIGAAVGFFMFIVAWIIRVLVDRADKATNEYQDFLESRIDELADKEDKWASRFDKLISRLGVKVDD